MTRRSALVLYDPMGRPHDPAPPARPRHPGRERARVRTNNRVNDARAVMRYGGRTPRTALAFARVHRPDLVATFGEAALLAAPTGPRRRWVPGCRWCAASLAARVHGYRPPDRMTKGHLNLLGDPCDACTRRLADATAERADAQVRARFAAGQPGTYTCDSGCCDVEVAPASELAATSSAAAPPRKTYPRRYAQTVTAGGTVIREYEDRGDGVRRWTGKRIPLPGRRPDHRPDDLRRQHALDAATARLGGRVLYDPDTGRPIGREPPSGLPGGTRTAPTPRTPVPQPRRPTTEHRGHRTPPRT